MDVAAVERSFGELLAAFGDLQVGRSRGAPAEPEQGGMTALVRRYRSRRRAIDGALDGVGDEIEGEDARALANIRGVLVWLDETEPTPGIVQAGIGGRTAHDEADTRRRASLYRRFGNAAESIRVGGERLHRLTVLGRLASEPDAATRRGLFEALGELWRVVDGDGGERSPYRAIVRSGAARWAEHGSPIEANAAAVGIPAGSLAGTLRELLAAWRTVLGPGRIEPWDYWHTVGAASRRLDGTVSRERLLDVNHAYLRSLGADPDRLGIVYDVIPRPGRPVVPVAFTIGMGGWVAEQPAAGPWTPRPPWVFATYETGGLGNLLELLHESGHALHAAAVRTRPAFLEGPIEDTGWAEGLADVLGWDATEPAWQGRWLGEAADDREAVLDRYGAVILDVCWALFEIELFADPGRRPNEVWTEITADGLGVEPHPGWSWWALRGQLIESPGYMANYALSAIIAAAVRARILERRGPWWDGDPGWFGFVSAAMYAPGASRRPADLLEAFLGGPLSVEPLLADIRRRG